MKLFDRNDYRYSFFDGMCANVYGHLTGGVFLTGFALYLEMNAFMLGVMMAIPFIVTLFQWPGSYYICRTGGRKKIAIRTATIARLMWLPLLAVGMLPFEHTLARQWIVLMLFLSLQAFSSVSYIAWISWTSDLVPDEIRGVFFGTRNMLCAAAGIVTVLIFGNLVDMLSTGAGRSAWTFAMPFGCAVIFGLLSSHFLNRVADVPAPLSTGSGFFQQLSGPLKDRNFSRYLLFSLCWNFAVYLAAPFFSLYFLRELKYSYGFVALLTTIAALVDMCAMRFWGAVSDRVKNKAVIQLSACGVVFLPALWVLVRPQDVLAPMAIQIFSGGFWAGISLCSNNLLLRISAQPNRVWYISAYSISAGFGAALAPIIGGLILSVLDSHPPETGATGLLPLHYLFIASSVLRMASLLFFRFVHEPEEKNMRQTLQFLNPLGVFVTIRNKAAALAARTAAMTRRTGRLLRTFKRPVARQQM